MSYPITASGYSPEGSTRSHEKPQAVSFTDSTGKVAQYFFRNNPWKVSDSNDFQKFYRFCVLCGDNRFSDNEWSGVLVTAYDQLPIICNRANCYNNLYKVSDFVPRNHYIVRTPEDKDKVSSGRSQQNFEDI
ncbi:MAG: hypothetical protein VX777_00970 [Chlamydiota bacterium]|nr:hypothetical protein [Chlamydiota bacterium]